MGGGEKRRKMKRVMITGGPGAGKSTLARQLGDATGLPVTHIDQIAWLPGWQLRPREETAEIMHELQNRESWIIDGQYSLSMEHREQRADTIIFVDLPVTLRFWRVIKRIARSYGQVRPDMAEGCPEQFSWEFIKWIWSTHKRTRHRGSEIIARNKQQKSCHHLSTSREVADFLHQIEQQY